MSLRLFCWGLTGFVFCLLGYWYNGNSITVKDLFIASIFAIFGPGWVIAFGCCLVSDFIAKPHPILDRIILAGRKP